MENKNKENSSSIDIDKVCLKDHLNASFDNDSIKVSEELIARTLLAIKKDELSTENQQHNTNKFPIRRFVSAAAVILVLFVGIKVIQNNAQLDGFSLGSSKSSDSDTNTESSVVNDTATLSKSIQTDTAAGSESESNQTDVAADSESESIQTDVAVAETPMQETDKTLAVDQYDMTIAEGSTDGTKASVAITASTNLFSELYPFSADPIVSFSVTKRNQTMISTGNTEDLREFYSLLDEYILTFSEKDINETWSYKVEIETEKDETYTIMVGDGIQLRNEADPSGTYTYYAIKNVDTLIKSMDEFYNSLQ